MAAIASAELGFMKTGGLSALAQLLVGLLRE